MSEPVSCINFEGFAVLCALGELEAPLRAALEEHARACPDCAAILQREITLAAILAPNSRGAAEREPSDLLMARCRNQLSRSLDETTPGRPAVWTGLFSPREWLTALRVSPRFHPAWTVAALSLVAILSGLAGWQGLGGAPLRNFGPTIMTVSAAPPPAPVAAPIVNEAAQAPAAVAPPTANEPAAQPLETLEKEDLRVYSATDAGMNDALPHYSLAPDSGQALLGGDGSPRFWRNAPPPRRSSRLSAAAAWDAPAPGSFSEFSHRMETLWWGGVRIDPQEQQQRLVHAPSPEYPDAARRAGIEGQVTLLLRIAADGSVQDSQLLSGEPILGRAAAAALAQWHYSPLRIGGEPVSVLTSVTFSFELR